jgi:hypothetical protein
MSLSAIVLAQSGIGEMALFVLRVIAAIGGAFVGWFLSDPLARISYRIAVQKPIPGWSLPWVKMGGAALLGLLVYFLIPLGGGPGGWGFGPGLGGGPGKGLGEGGSSKETGAVAQDGKKIDDKKTTPADKGPRKSIEVEVLGGKRYPGEDRYYLLRSAGKAMRLKEVEEYFTEHGGKLELRVILTDESPDRGQGIIEDLRRLADRFEIPNVLQETKGSKSK